MNSLLDLLSLAETSSEAVFYSQRRHRGVWRGACHRRNRAAVLRASLPTTHKRETWYRERLHSESGVAICHSKVVETGLDYVK